MNTNDLHHYFEESGEAERQWFFDLIEDIPAHLEPILSEKTDIL